MACTGGEAMTRSPLDCLLRVEKRRLYDDAGHCIGYGVFRVVTGKEVGRFTTDKYPDRDVCEYLAIVQRDDINGGIE
jgi:hypothetical protein